MILTILFGLKTKNSEKKKMRGVGGYTNIKMGECICYHCSVHEIGDDHHFFFNCYLNLGLIMTYLFKLNKFNNIK